VKVCSTYGAGFFVVPGTESCLRIGGRVRADFLYAEPFTRAQDSFGIRARGRLNVDYRTATAYGLLRTYLRFEITQNSGSFSQGAVTTDPQITQAFVQFGGLTAGRVTSFWDNPDLPTQHFGTLRFSDAPDVALLAYTFSFGNGFSATLSAENGEFRRVGYAAVTGIDPLTGLPTAVTSPFYAGQSMPDIVGNVRYSGTWGGVQLNGAIHQNRGLFIPAAVSPTGIALTPDTDYGWAVGGSAWFNLPFLGAGDVAWIAPQYADGALGYLGLGQNTRAGIATGFAQDVFAFADADTASGKGWSIAGGMTHYWTPTFRSSIFGSWADINFSGRTNAFFGIDDFREYRIGGNTIWSPVSGLNIGLEVIYANVDGRGTGAFRGDSATEGRLRIQRDF
jgi:hypothetical protein